MPMLRSIKTSEKNRELVAELTAKLGFGPENLIARIAFAYSISRDRRLHLSDMQDSKGKEYSGSVLFGDYLPVYIALVCQHYDLPKFDYDVPKYIKMHIDDGLERIHGELKASPNLDLFDYIMERIISGLDSL